MPFPDLHWIAEQLLSGKVPEEVDYRMTNLSWSEKLQLANQALSQYPSEAALHPGSNEVVLPVPETPGNIQPFNRFPKAPASPRKAPRESKPPASHSGSAAKGSPLKVHWRLKVAAWRQKQTLYLVLLRREESLQSAYRNSIEGNGDWAAVERVHLEYIDTIRDVNAFISSVWDDQEAYYWTRSKSWQNSNSAWAYQAWMEAWELEVLSPSLPPRLGDANLNLSAAKTFWAIPNEPSE